MKYDHQKIEAKWQDYWEKNKTFKTQVNLKKKKLYILDMFPYPSGSGLHVGHPLGYTATDIYSRYKRLQGFNILHPIGWDAFGLPAEQYAIKTGTHPAETTEKNIERYRKQLQMLGFSYDWDREINTTDPKYYKWTQWIFLKLYKKGLAYEAEAPVNWCPELKAVLSNEEVVDGKSHIGNHPVFRVPMRQWMLRITNYAESLLTGLENLDWPDSVKELQRNWIGKSEGVNINFNLPSINTNIMVYTTRPDTLFGSTYLVMSPEHPLVNNLVAEDQKETVRNYCEEASKKSDLDRGELNKNKTGVPLNTVAINPVNDQEIPIWVADYVLMGYGTGAIMAVPGHDNRDFEFATKFKLPIVEVVLGGDISEAAFTDNENGIMVNSSNIYGLDLNGLKVQDAIQKTIEWLTLQGRGEKSVQYKLRDWLFSRQRYWGEPIPIIHQENGEIAPLTESDLPLTLPTVHKYEPTGTGESPLAGIDKWINTKSGKRESNTMPQWAGSCWYYLRYIDPENNDEPWDKELESYWMPVDLYVGGIEHAVLHLLYSRFWHHVLYDLDLVSTREPFQKLFNQGMIMGEDGQKMSKSRGNVINPDDVVREYGADSFRLYEMFMGPLEKSKPWNTKGLQGCRRFLQKVWNLYTDDSKIILNNCANAETKIILHKTIKKVTVDLDNLRFNTAISQMMIFVNHLQEQKTLDKEVLNNFLILLNPFSPHITEEINELFNQNKKINQKLWPKYDNSILVDKTVIIVVQINGKTKDTLSIAKDSSKEEVKQKVKNLNSFKRYIMGKKIKREVYVQNRLINYVL